jgi:hypothetical protein
MYVEAYLVLHWCLYADSRTRGGLAGAIEGLHRGSSDRHRGEM